MLTKTFEVWWPNLEESLNSIKSGESDEENNHSEKDLNNEMLEEILELSRTNQKILRSPDILLPQDYFEFIMREKGNREFSEKERYILEEQRHYLMEVQHRISQVRDIVEAYKTEKRPIDEEFYEYFIRYLDVAQRYYRLSEQTERIYNRKLS